MYTGSESRIHYVMWETELASKEETQDRYKTKNDLFILKRKNKFQYVNLRKIWAHKKRSTEKEYI